MTSMSLPILSPLSCKRCQQSSLRPMSPRLSGPLLVAQIRASRTNRTLRARRSLPCLNVIATGNLNPESWSSSDIHHAETERKKLWFKAIKPPMYSVGFIPVLVGAAAAFATTGSLSSARCAGFVLGSIFVIAWLNLSNDAFDASTGVDKTKAESVVNLTGSRLGVLLLSKALLISGVALMSLLIYSTGDWRIFAMLAVAISCGYIYQGPPFRLSYQGIGEPLCFLAFGPMATPAFFLALLPTSGAAHMMAISPMVWAVSVIVGLTTTVILFCSHWHQIEGDKANNKKSPLVRLGSTQQALPILQWLLISPYAVAVGAAVCHYLPWLVVAAMSLTLPVAWQTWRFAISNHDEAARIAPLKMLATGWHIAVGLTTAAGLVLTTAAAA